MSYLITEAWLSSFHMIPIALVYSFSEMNDCFDRPRGAPPGVPVFMLIKTAFMLVTEASMPIAAAFMLIEAAFVLIEVAFTTV